MLRLQKGRVKTALEMKTERVIVNLLQKPMSYLERRELVGEVPSEVAVPEFFLTFGKISLHLVTRRRRRKVENIVGLVSDANYDARELCRHMKAVDDCKRILDDSKHEILNREGLGKVTVKKGRVPSASGALMYVKTFLAVIRRQMATSSSPDVFFMSQDVMEGILHSVQLLHGQDAQKKMRERVMAPKERDVCFIRKSNQLSKLFAQFIQIYLQKMATLLKFNPFVFYQADKTLLNFAERRSKILDCSRVQFVRVSAV